MTKLKFIILALLVTTAVALGTTGFGMTYLEQIAALESGLGREVSRDINGAVGGAGTSEDPLLRTLQNLKNITLDPAIFSRSDFLSLVDFSLVLIEQPRGRNNPFAPLTPGETFSVAPSANIGTTTRTNSPAFEVNF